MPRLVPGTPTGPVFVTATGAHHYRFIGLEITAPVTAPGQQNYGLVFFDSAHYEGATYVPQVSLDQVPHHLIIDRCYIHGQPTGEYLRGVLMNSAFTAIVDSYLSDFHSVGSDTQAAISWNGPGPFKLVNNYLEAAGENVMFGGAAASIPNLVPSDIEVRHNHFRKPLTWYPQSPTYAGTQWSVKNLFEFKNGQRALIEGNLFEDHWAGAQSGFFFIMTPRGENGANPWATASDITFRYNWVRRTTAGIAVSGTDGLVTQHAARIAISNNVFEDLGLYVAPGAFNGDFLLAGNAITDLVVDHNTIFNSYTPMYLVGLSTGPMTGFVFTNNILNAAGYGIVADGVGGGITGLNAYAPGALVVKNLAAGPQAALLWPASQNLLASSLDAAGFVNASTHDYHLLPSSPYHNAGTDGRDLGADIDGIAQATVGSATP